MKKLKVYEIEVPEFMTHVTLSKARRKGSIRTIGKPRLKKIRGQDFYVGMNHNLRAKMVKEMKKYLYEFIRKAQIEINPEDYPLRLEFEVYHTVTDKRWDLGNFCMIWRKCFEDALCGNVEFVDKIPDRTNYPAVIIDDSIHYLIQYEEKFIPVEQEEDRKFIFRIICLGKP